MNNKFDYLVDQFADIKILRFIVANFDQLNFREKQYVYYLSEAAKWGRDITWLQLGKYNLNIRKTLENIIETYQGNKKNQEYNKFIVYAKRVFFSHGFHHHYSKDKFFPECSIKYFEKLLDDSDINKFTLIEHKTFPEFKEWFLNLIYSPEKEKTGDLLKDDFTDFYQNITEKEAKKFYGAKTDLLNKEHISFGLNTKLIKENETIKELVYCENGMYGKIISKIIYYLEKALKFANNSQKEYTNLLINYFKTGDLKLWDEYSIKWVSDNESNIDYINGFIEVYDDPIGYKGMYEAMVNMKDLEATKVTNIIAKKALWFEKHSPVDARFKKEKVNGVNAKAIHAITLAGDIYPSAAIGINLPNANWIREKHGSKSVTITNLTSAYTKASQELPKKKRKEFIYSDEIFELENKYIDEADDLHTHLHECLGHGSGKLLEGVSQNALKEYYSALEEARADIFSLYYMADYKLIELGISSSIDLAKAYYGMYIRGGLQVQLTRVELGKDIVEAHMVARKLISTWVYEKGKKENVIEKRIKNSKTYFVVNDVQKLRELFKELLIELQRIKSTGDYEAGKLLIENYGIKVDYELHKEVLERYKKLNLKPYSGFMNPEIIEVLDNNQIIDYKIIYPTDFLIQNMEYGKKYSI